MGGEGGEGKRDVTVGQTPYSTPVQARDQTARPQAALSFGAVACGVGGFVFSHRFEVMRAKLLLSLSKQGARAV